MDINKLVISGPDILSGQAVFVGTRVLVETLFDHLEAGVLFNEFSDDFPTVTKEQAMMLLDVASKLLTARSIQQVYAIAA